MVFDGALHLAVECTWRLEKLLFVSELYFVWIILNQLILEQEVLLVDRRHAALAADLAFALIASQDLLDLLSCDVVRYLIHP